jgi:hypothetical protein
MRAYPLRLPDELADTARQHAERLGISFNAFVSVALDAYIRGGTPAPNKASARPVAPRKPAPRKPSKPAKLAPVEPPAGADHFGQRHPDPRNWRNFHDPEMWPWVDPDWTPPPGISNPWHAPGISDPEDVKPADLQAFEAAYWKVHKRPERPWIETGEVPY